MNSKAFSQPNPVRGETLIRLSDGKLFLVKRVPSYEHDPDKGIRLFSKSAFKNGLGETVEEIEEGFWERWIRPS